MFSKKYFPLVLYAFCFLQTHGQNSDSSALYTLKENERIIYRDEHRLLIGNNRIAHLLFLQRPTGHFILYDGKEFGPFELVGFTESNSSLFDWAVKSNGKWYQLVLDRQKLYGPYDGVVDVYRSYEFSPPNPDALPGAHFGFRASRQGAWFANIDGKEYGPYKELDIGTPFFVTNNGTVRAYLKYDYTVSGNVYKYFAIGDSVVLGPSGERDSPLSKRGADLYWHDVKAVPDVAGYKIDASGKNYVAIDLQGSVYLNGKRQQHVPPVEIASGYYINGPYGFVHDSNEFFVRTKAGEKYEYYISSGRPGPPASGDAYEPLHITKDSKHIAYERNGTIFVDGQPVHTRGFSLMYNPEKDCFSWLTVKDRTIYIHYSKS